MPIYEFYCRRCNTIFNFLARSANTERIPNCPKCKRVKLARQMSIFANISGNRDAPAEGPDLPPMDEAKMEKAMAMLTAEADKINEDDPRQAAALMRKLSEATGLNLGAGMEEALNRLERGEDPDRIEEEMGDLLETEEPFILNGGGKKRKGKTQPKPLVDETLYDL